MVFASVTFVLGIVLATWHGEYALFPGTLVEQGASLQTAPLAPGVHLFECLIHPWMRATLRVG